MSQEFFWGGELNEQCKEITWKPESELDGEDDDSKFMHTLVLTHAHIGADNCDMAEEPNIVELETVGYGNAQIKLPIIRLQRRLLHHCKLDILIPKMAKFRLINGTGPVFLHGQHLVEWDDDDGDDLLLNEEVVKECPKSPHPNQNQTQDQTEKVEKAEEVKACDDDQSNKTSSSKKTVKLKSKSKTSV